MAADYEKTISQLKENLEKSKSMKFRAEAKLEQLNKQKEEIISEIKSMGLEPDNLDQEISKLQEQIDVLIEESKEMLPIL
jgi:chromosome segregation ATPase